MCECACVCSVLLSLTHTQTQPNNSLSRLWERGAVRPGWRAIPWRPSAVHSVGLSPEPSASPQPESQLLSLIRDSAPESYSINAATHSPHSSPLHPSLVALKSFLRRSGCQGGKRAEEEEEEIMIIKKKGEGPSCGELFFS